VQWRKKEILVDDQCESSVLLFSIIKFLNKILNAPKDIHCPLY